MIPTTESAPLWFVMLVVSLSTFFYCITAKDRFKKAPLLWSIVTAMSLSLATMFGAMMIMVIAHIVTWL